jgi:alkylated DNA repair dioxygenase AlkB
MKSKATLNYVQGDLFTGFASDISVATPDEVSKEVLSMPDAKVIFYRNFFNREDSDELFRVLLEEINWRQDKMNVYGKEVNLPRKTAWYGDSNKSYTFSGIHLEPEPWTPTLIQVKERIEEVAEVEFNSVLLNLYRSGSDGISWHTDAERELGENPIIGSVSFGETRRFMFRHRYDKEMKAEVDLTHGSFLLMAGETQHFWQHQIPKTSRKIEARINLTFRLIID